MYRFSTTFEAQERVSGAFEGSVQWEGSNALVGVKIVACRYVCCGYRGFNSTTAVVGGLMLGPGSGESGGVAGSIPRKRGSALDALFLRWSLRLQSGDGVGFESLNGALRLDFLKSTKLGAVSAFFGCFDCSSRAS